MVNIGNFPTITQNFSLSAGFLAGIPQEKSGSGIPELIVKADDLLKSAKILEKTNNYPAYALRFALEAIIRAQSLEPYTDEQIADAVSQVTLEEYFGKAENGKYASQAISQGSQTLLKNLGKTIPALEDFAKLIVNPQNDTVKETKANFEKNLTLLREAREKLELFTMHELVPRRLG